MRACTCTCVVDSSTSKLKNIACTKHFVNMYSVHKYGMRTCTCVVDSSASKLKNHYMYRTHC